MFKDYNKYLSVSVQVYLFVLVVIFIMKLVGLDYFGLDVNNPTLIQINNFAFEYNLINVWYFITLYIYTWCILSVACNERKVIFKTLIYTIIGVIIKVVENLYCTSFLVAIIDILYLYLICLINNRKYSIKEILKRITKIIALTFVYQSISMLTRVGNNIDNSNYTFIQFVLLDLDFIMMYIITYLLYFNEGRWKLCTMEVGYFLLKKISLKKSLKRLQEKLRNFKKLDKVTRLTYIIYFILSLFWNVLTITLVLLIARLNNTLVECLFILTSFWLSKRTFGKAFHLSSMVQCFIVSNITYYALNKITMPLGISIFVPIMLGVGLSYVTSKFVKRLYKPLYKGMPKELFEETILKVVDKDSVQYKICYDYFINKKSALNLSLKYNYSEVGIRKIKDRINAKIKKL